MAKHYRILHVLTGTFLLDHETKITACFYSFDRALSELEQFVYLWEESDLVTEEQEINKSSYTWYSECVYENNLHPIEEYEIIEFDEDT